MTLLAAGAAAPDFALATDIGAPAVLADFRGRPLVLFFYPQDDTEGCTIENLEFNALKVQFDDLRVAVLGVSPDTVESHAKFRRKYGLDIRLGSDPERRTIMAYGAWGAKRMFGRDYDGVIRSTFLIDADGTIAESFRVTRVKGHAERTLHAARDLVAG